jgi:glycosyltransferase involved in cell wall biosynthesis/SAM-dependent methyltransferase
MVNVDVETVAGFGREWGHFDQLRLGGEEYADLFETYFRIFPFNELPRDSEGFDLGCGSGRWAAGVAPRVGKLHCIDPAREALDVAKTRLKGIANVSFHLASADAIPLPDESQDFGYSLGVLHHIPDTPSALADAVRKLKPGAPFLLYVYYRLENRPAWFRAIWRGTDVVRRGIARLPFGARKAITSVIAATVYWPLARTAGAVEKIGHDPSSIPLSAYRDRSFYTMRTDALDRFGTKLEKRFTRAEIEQMMTDAGLVDIQFAPGPPYWIACGRRARAARAPKEPFTVSVVIPLFNKEQAVECTLKSVLHQTRKPDEVIIVDDGSTDGSTAAIDRVLKAQRPSFPVRVISQENQGVSAARNRGADEARFDYIAFLDADDEWLPDYLGELERLASACPNADVLAMRYARSDERGSVVSAPTVLGPDFFGLLDHPIETYRKGYGIIHSSSVTVRKSAWRRSGGFAVGAQNGEDIACWLKLMLSERFAHSGKTLIIWHDEFSGAASRVGAVPHHFSYFLGTSEGRQFLKHRALVEFLGSNLAVQVGGRRLAGDQSVVAELRRLSSALPLRFRSLCMGTAIAPRWLLRRAMSWRRGSYRRAGGPVGPVQPSPIGRVSQSKL